MTCSFCGTAFSHELFSNTCALQKMLSDDPLTVTYSYKVAPWMHERDEQEGSALFAPMMLSRALFFIKQVEKRNTLEVIPIRNDRYGYVSQYLIWGG